MQPEARDGSLGAAARQPREPVGGDGVIGRDLQSLVAAGMMRMLERRVVSAHGPTGPWTHGRTVVLADGNELSTDAVLWCNGFQSDYDWLDVDSALDEQGRPVHDAGRSPVEGLHWVGLPWQTRLNSGILDGVDRDARDTAARIARELAARPAAETTSATPDPGRAADAVRTAGGRT